MFRLFSLQVLDHRIYLEQARAQHENKVEISPQRGKIYLQDKNDQSFILATNHEYYNLFAVPRELQKLEERERLITEIAVALSPLINLPEETIKKRLDKGDDPYEPLAERLNDDLYFKIQELDFPGLHFSKEWKRWYPQETLAAHVLGFVGQREDTGEIGQYGLEGFFNDLLAGQKGFSADALDAQGSWTGLSLGGFLAPVDGSDLYLTLDQNIQFMIEKELAQAIETWGAKSGSVVVMDPKTGDVLGMASQPNFNPNKYFETEDINVFLNPVVQEIYEPGSIFKPITMSAAIDSGRVSPTTTFVDTGSLTIGGYTITNAANRVFGESSMTRVLELSINTGAVFAQQKMEKDDFKNYLESFKFGHLLGIDLVGEVMGNIRNLNYKRDIDYATISFGQGIGVTPLQIVSALSAIANGGKIMRPHIVEKIVTPDGQEKKVEPEEIAQPISSQTASKLSAMLVSTVQNGYDKVKIKGYYVAGKTGTAQVPDPEGGGYLDEYVHSFVGFAPAYDPKFIVLIKLDQPQGVRFASSSLSQVFTNITKFLLNYFEIPPDFEND